MSEISRADKDTWAELVRRHWSFIHARMGLLRMEGAVELVRSGLHDPGERMSALAIVPYLAEEARKSLLPDLVSVASFGHAQLGEAYARILELPRAWVLENVDPHVERKLEDGTYEEYRALMGLYQRLGAPDRVERLARRAAASDDPDTREAGEDFLNAPAAAEPGPR